MFGMQKTRLCLHEGLGFARAVAQTSHHEDICYAPACRMLSGSITNQAARAGLDRSALSGTVGRLDIALPYNHLSMRWHACAGPRQATKDSCSQDTWRKRSRAQQPKATTEPQDPRTLRCRNVMLETLLTARLQAACKGVSLHQQHAHVVCNAYQALVCLVRRQRASL